MRFYEGRRNYKGILLVDEDSSPPLSQDMPKIREIVRKLDEGQDPKAVGKDYGVHRVTILRIYQRYTSNR